VIVAPRQQSSKAVRQLIKEVADKHARADGEAQSFNAALRAIEKAEANRTNNAP
jgi:hypothetical protein